MIEATQSAFQLPQGLLALRRRFGVYQIRNRLGFRQIELAVFKSAAREFAGLGQAKARQAAKRFGHIVQDGAPAVNVKFHDVLAGIAVRRRKPDHNGLIDRLAGLTVDKTPEGRFARRRNAGRDAEIPKQFARRRAGHAHDGNPRFPGR
jgi:hypothetical protein